MGPLLRALVGTFICVGGIFNRMSFQLLHIGFMFAQPHCRRCQFHCFCIGSCTASSRSCNCCSKLLSKICIISLSPCTKILSKASCYFSRIKMPILETSWFISMRIQCCFPGMFEIWKENCPLKWSVFVPDVRQLHSLSTHIAFWLDKKFCRIQKSSTWHAKFWPQIQKFLARSPKKSKI